MDPGAWDLLQLCNLHIQQAPQRWGASEKQSGGLMCAVSLIIYKLYTHGQQIIYSKLDIPVITEQEHSHSVDSFCFGHRTH